MAEANIPQPMDTAGDCLLYDELKIKSFNIWNDAIEAYNDCRAQILDYQNPRVGYANAVLDKLINWHIMDSGVRCQTGRYSI